MKKIILLIMVALVGLSFSPNKAEAALANEVVRVAQEGEKIHFNSMKKIQTTTLKVGTYYIVEMFMHESSYSSFFEDNYEFDIVGCTTVDDVSYQHFTHLYDIVASKEILDLFKTGHYQDYDSKFFYVFYPESELTSFKGDDIKNIYEISHTIEPVINSNDIHIIDYDHPLTLDQIKARYHASDNFDSNITSKITFKTDYPTNLRELKAKEYYIDATVEDTSHNKTHLYNKIVVEDHNVPEFFGRKTFVKALGEKLTFEEIFKDITCYDACDGAIPSSKFKVKDNKTINPNIITEQYFTITCTDKAGNTGSVDIMVQFNDDEYPVITVDGVVKASVNHKLSENEIIDILKNSNRIPQEYKSAKIESDYFTTDSEGVYSSLCTLELNDGSISHYRFKIDAKADLEPVKDNSLWIALGSLGGTLALFASGALIYYLRKKHCLRKVEKL